MTSHIKKVRSLADVLNPSDCLREGRVTQALLQAQRSDGVRVNDPVLDN